MPPPPAIHAEHLGKRYRVGKRPRYRMFRDALREGLRHARNALLDRTAAGPNVLWALEDVDLSVPAGRSVGIIGSNGAGKSTLLKILSRVTAPTKGHARIRGRVGSLLEVGTGFHPELTGRENVFLNGAILGMRKDEIERKFDPIVEFAAVEEFLDTPVKFYSSGMRMRLAFSVAVHLEPEILLIDEVLAVGDAAFQSKSLAKMSDVIRSGKTIVFVSHNMAAVRALCQEAVYIDKGRIRHRGPVDETIDAYLTGGRDQRADRFHAEPNLDRPFQFLDAYVLDREGRPTSRLPHDQPFQIAIRLAVRVPQWQMRPGLSIVDSQQETVFSSYDFGPDEEAALHLTAGTYRYVVGVPAPLLVPGQYRLTLELVRSFSKSSKAFGRIEHICPFEVFDNGSEMSRASISWRGRVSPSLEWERFRESSTAPGDVPGPT